MLSNTDPYNFGVSMKHLRLNRLALVGALVLSFLSVPVASQASRHPITVTVSNTRPNLYDQVTLTASGVTTGNTYAFVGTNTSGATTIATATADASGVAAVTISWGVTLDCPLPISECYYPFWFNGVYRQKLTLVDVADTAFPPTVLATSDNIYAGQNYKMGTTSFSGPGYQNGKFVEGQNLHVSATNVADGANGMYGVVIFSTAGNTVDDFWDAVYADAPQVNLLQTTIAAGVVEEDVTIPSLPSGNLQMMVYYLGFTGDAVRPMSAGISAVLESDAGTFTGSTPTPTPTASETPTPTPTPSDTPTVDPTPTDTPSETPTPTDTPTVDPTPTDTPTVDPTPSETPSIDPTPTPSDSPQPTIDECAANIGDPALTADAILAIIGLTREELQAGQDSGYWHITLATGSGEFGNGYAYTPDIFCGNSQDNLVSLLDSDTSNRDYFFGGAGDDSVVESWFSTFYGGDGNDTVGSVREVSHFYGGAGTNSCPSVGPDSTCDVIPPNNFINSITQTKAWASVDFTLPTLATGKYDRVAYSVDGGSWVMWGANAKSAQYIKGLKLGRTYSIRIKARVKRGRWTEASEPVEVTMKKIRGGVVVP